MDMWKKALTMVLFLCIIIGIQIAVVSAAEDNLDEKIENYTKQIEEKPNEAELYYLRGNVYLHKGQNELAIADYTRTIELHPKADNAFNNRGLAYIRLKQYDLAMADFNRALEIYAKNTNAYYNRADVYQIKKQYGMAIVDYNKFIELKPQNADGYYRRGAAYHNSAKYDLAIADYTKSIELNPNNSDTYYNRGIVYNNLGQTDNALADYNKAIELNPQGYNIYYSRGMIYYSKGQLALAKTDYNKAMEIDPQTKRKYYSALKNKPIKAEDIRFLDSDRMTQQLDKGLTIRFLRVRAVYDTYLGDNKTDYYYNIWKGITSVYGIRSMIVIFENTSSEEKIIQWGESTLSWSSSPKPVIPYIGGMEYRYAGISAKTPDLVIPPQKRAFSRVGVPYFQCITDRYIKTYHEWHQIKGEPVLRDGSLTCTLKIKVIGNDGAQYYTVQSPPIGVEQE